MKKIMIKTAFDILNALDYLRTKKIAIKNLEATNISGKELEIFDCN